MTIEDTRPRTIAEVAADIRKAWPKPYFGAVPYIEAMLEMNVPLEKDSVRRAKYLYDSATDILMRFLLNASTFRGPSAKALKAELRSAL